MLPSFSRVKKNLYKDYFFPIFEQIRMRDPLLSGINKVIYHEGDKSNYQTVEGEIISPEMVKISSDTKITVEEVEKQDIELIAKKLVEIAEYFSSQQAQHIFKTVSQATEKVGNTLDAKGEPLSPEHMLQMIEKVQIDFDENTGQPSFPTLYIHPSMHEQAVKMIEKADSDPSYKARFDEIIERKRKEWNDREANRKLVD